MTITLSFKPGLDRPLWRPEPLAITNNVSGACFAYDMRNDNTRHPISYYLRSSSNLDEFNPVVGDWFPLSTPALTGVAAGSAIVFHPSQGPRGTISAASSANSFTLSSLVTAGGAAVGTNQLADRGDGLGFLIRVADNAAGATGKTEVVRITGNSSGATPVVQVFPSLTFTPTVNSVYEILSGRVFLLGSGALASGSWRYYDIATNSYTTKTQTNLAATIATDSFLLAMSELYVSSDRKPGDGFISTGAPATYNNGNNNCCVATASGSVTVTSAALKFPLDFRAGGTGADPSLATNEFRNFQIRIVEDTGTPTAVGQRRNITSHTSGNTPAFTVPVWTVTPSATAKFVVELNDDRILCRTSASTNMYNYSISGDAWDASTTWTAGGTANGAGNMIMPCFGLVRDPTNNRLQGDIFVFRGGNSNTLDLFQPTAGATGAWTATVAFGGSSNNVNFTTGACGCSDPVCNGGQYFHITIPGATSAPNHMYRFNVMTQSLESGSFLAYPSAGGLVGQCMFMSYAFDGASKVPVLYKLLSAAQQMFSQIIPF